jgi:hypothetical protein
MFGISIQTDFPALETVSTGDNLAATKLYVKIVSIATLRRKCSLYECWNAGSDGGHTCESEQLDMPCSNPSLASKSVRTGTVDIPEALSARGKASPGLFDVLGEDGETCPLRPASFDAPDGEQSIEGLTDKPNEDATSRRRPPCSGWLTVRQASASVDFDWAWMPFRQGNVAGGNVLACSQWV